MRGWLWNVVSGGLPRDHDLEVLRKMLMSNLITILGIGFLATFATTSLLQREYVLSAVDYTVMVFLVVVFVYLRVTKNIGLISKISTVAIACFFAFLIGHGGVDNTAYLWAFTYPLISLFLMGSVLGSIMTFGLLGVACTIFALGPSVAAIAEYDMDLIVRFVGAYASVSLFALAMEQVRDLVQARLSDANRALEELVEVKQNLIRDLEQTMEEVSTLQGILPICCHCKNVLDDSGYWERVEEYVRARSRAQFSHSICPDCLEKLYPEFIGTS